MEQTKLKELFDSLTLDEKNWTTGSTQWKFL